MAVLCSGARCGSACVPIVPIFVRTLRVVYMHQYARSSVHPAHVRCMSGDARSMCARVVSAYSALHASVSIPMASGSAFLFGDCIPSSRRARVSAGGGKPKRSRSSRILSHRTPVVLLRSPPDAQYFPSPSMPRTSRLYLYRVSLCRVCGDALSRTGACHVG